MGKRLTNEPPYPQTADEVTAYCTRLVHALQTHVGERLVCVLLCGSWARGEAQPPTSDTDITVIVNTVDDTVLPGLQAAWQAAEMGHANVYGADEVAIMSHEALEMYTTNACVVWGTNPFPTPTQADFAEEVGRSVEYVNRYARGVLLYAWLTPAERQNDVDYMLHDLHRLIQNMLAFRSGAFPKNTAQFRASIVGTDEEVLLQWIEAMPAEVRLAHALAIAERVNAYTQDCVHAVELFRS